MSNVKPIPEGFHSITPYIVVEDAGKLADFLVAAFGAKEHHRTSAPDGSVMHADLIIGDSHVMLGGAPGQKAVPCMLYLYVTEHRRYIRARSCRRCRFRDAASESVLRRSQRDGERSGRKFLVHRHARGGCFAGRFGSARAGSIQKASRAETGIT